MVVIFEQLKLLGVSDEKFSKSLEARMAIGLPSFHLDYRTEIDGHSMRFRLYFQRTGMDRSYFLQKYDAILMQPIRVADDTIAGVNSIELEERMKRIDWATTAENPFLGIMVRSHYRTICDDLQKIKSATTLGWAIDQQLRLKYWSDTPFESPELEQLKMEFQTRKTFTSTLPTIEHCYHIYFRLWEVRCQLLERLAHLGFDLEAYVDRKLRSHHPGNFELEIHGCKEEGVVTYTIPVVWDPEIERYSIENFTASLVRYQPILHGVYAEVDTEELEQKMAAVDWDNEFAHYTEGEEDPRFIPEIEEIVSILQYQLTKDPDGKKTAAQLQAKYWPGSPDFEGMMSSEAWDYIKEQPIVKSQFGNDIHTSEAYNLLCGRSIAASWDAEGIWLRLDFDLITNAGHPKVQFVSYSKQELETILRVYPIPTGEIDRICEGMLHGDIVSTRLLTGPQIRLAADPKNKTIKFFTEDLTAMDLSNLSTARLTDKSSSDTIPNVTEKQSSSMKTDLEIDKKRKGPKL